MKYRILRQLNVYTYSCKKRNRFYYKIQERRWFKWWDVGEWHYGCWLLFNPISVEKAIDYIIKRFGTQSEIVSQWKEV